MELDPDEDPSSRDSSVSIDGYKSPALAKWVLPFSKSILFSMSIVFSKPSLRGGSAVPQCGDNAVLETSLSILRASDLSRVLMFNLKIEVTNLEFGRLPLWQPFPLRYQLPF